MKHGKIIEACARAAHEANRAYCIGIGDYSQPSWDDAPDWQRSSARDGVTGALDGATKDPDVKTHPCMVEYAELPPAQRKKDHIFIAVVNAVAEALDEALGG